jgi:N-acetylmuramoyl-L-alanine amidase
VLYKTAMPSVLIEIGFISNPNEEKFLRSEEGQTYIASAIFRAFRDYKVAYEKENANADSDADTDTDTDTDKLIDSDKDKVIYKVQIESRSRKVDVPSQHYKGLKNIDYYEHNGQYKYTAGKFYSKSEADEYCKKVKTSGYSSAFVVSFKNGKRL